MSQPNWSQRIVLLYDQLDQLRQEIRTKNGVDSLAYTELTYNLHEATSHLHKARINLKNIEDKKNGLSRYPDAKSE